MAKPLVLVLHWLPDGELARWRKTFPQCEFIDGNQPGQMEGNLVAAEITYGLPPVERLADARQLRWLQLAWAGVPGNLCEPAKKQKIVITNLAGLYGPTIAEHALAMMLVLSRNLHVAHNNQRDRKWDRTIVGTMRDLHGQTLAVVGTGNIGQNIARLGKSLGMRVIGCRRRTQPTPWVDRIFGPGEIRTMLAEAQFVAVAAPLVPTTAGMLGPAEFQAMPRGSFYINVSRGAVAQEPALLQALESGHLAGAGLDAFAAEPLPPEHPFWTMPNVLVSPHFSGEIVNNSSLPAQRFVRNLSLWLAHRQDKLEGTVDLDMGY